MINPGRFLVIFLVLLIIFTIGGFFLLDYKNQENIRQENVDISKEEKISKAKDGQISESNETTEEPDIEVSETQNSVAETEKIIEEAQKLISETQQYINEQRFAIYRAQTLSGKVKGLYMTEFIANGQSKAAKNIRENIIKLISETELNALVIDIKEAGGPNLPDSLKKTIDELHQKNIWVIARICAFRDTSLLNKKPEWYLKEKAENTTSTSTTTTATTTTTGTEEFWKDSGGGYWLDPASKEVQDYIINFSKQAIDFGFDELQFDYIRFPSDGDLKKIVYPVYKNDQKKYEVIAGFFSDLSKSLKSYKPSIILSVDIFGNVATQYQVPGIGQRLQDIAEGFDYISFMLYPSHFYKGFQVGEDFARELPAIYYPYESEDIKKVVSNHPYEVVYRSLLTASDYLTGLGSSVKIRPWLQDFNLKFDNQRGILYDAEKIKAQIKAVEDSSNSGWLIWSPSNIYTDVYTKEDSTEDNQN